jgi:hypothetical protein
MAGLTQAQIDKILADYNAARQGKPSPLARARLKKQVQDLDDLAQQHPGLLERFIAESQAERAGRPDPIKEQGGGALVIDFDKGRK